MCLPQAQGPITHVLEHPLPEKTPILWGGQGRPLGGGGVPARPCPIPSRRHRSSFAGWGLAQGRA